MRIFAIRDETMPEDVIPGYLIYHEPSKSFYIELHDGADFWNVPLFLSAFADRGEYSIDSFWSRRFVQQRIVPQDRQNIAQILRDNGLKEYDEFSLLMLAMGRCEQDDCYLEEIDCNELPEFLLNRWKTRVKDVVPLECPRILVFFANGMTKAVNLEELSFPSIAPYLAAQERFESVEVQPGGFGIYWNDHAMIPHRKLYTHGVTVPISLDAIHHYVQNRIVSASEACNILNCSRQNIDDLMRRDKLHPIRTDSKYKLFSKAEVMQRKKE